MRSSKKGIKTFRGQFASESVTFHDSLTSSAGQSGIGLLVFKELRTVICKMDRNHKSVVLEFAEIFNPHSRTIDLSLFSRFTRSSLYIPHACTTAPLLDKEGARRLESRS